ncbi:hypothetical protein HYV64_02410 [Candidatus Shapirobacteria bacterium]|nr:hypothetical protein [Candidatus Shapirobacteria bacterium]
MSCLVARKVDIGGFYCPLTDVIYAKRADVPFCRNYAQQAACGIVANQVISRESGLGGVKKNEGKSSGLSPTVEGMPHVKGRGKSKK